ncbi:hypothetical protein KSW81_007049 [Nannochloris sp. 'desiccata']|nr:hypothetical protein KSW81_007049 [Chlorella desiccata (nom. nud.)]
MSVPTLYTSSPDGCFAEASFCRPQCIILDRQCWGGAIYITDSPPPVQVAGTKGDPAMAAAGGRGGRGGAREGGNGRRGGRSGAVGRGGAAGGESGAAGGAGPAIGGARPTVPAAAGPVRRARHRAKRYGSNKYTQSTNDLITYAYPRENRDNPAQKASPATLEAVETKLNHTITDIQVSAPLLTLQQKVTVAQQLEKIVRVHCCPAAPVAAAAAKQAIETTLEAGPSKDPQAKAERYIDVIGTQTQTQQHSKKRKQAQEEEARGAPDGPVLQNRAARRTATVRNKVDLIQPMGHKRK